MSDVWQVLKNDISVANFIWIWLVKHGLSIVLCNEVGSDQEVHLNYESFFSYLPAKIVKELLNLKMEKIFLMKRWYVKLADLFLWPVATLHAS